MKKYFLVLFLFIILVGCKNFFYGTTMNFYYVHDYINQFALLVNTTRNFGDAYTNLAYGFHYFITPSDSDRAKRLLHTNSDTAC